VAQLILYGTVIINIFIPQCHIIIVGPPANKNKYLLTVPNNLILKKLPYWKTTSIDGIL
jgi:hypothetical protein